MENTESRIRLRTVTIAGVLQLLFALAFLIAPVAGVPRITAPAAPAVRTPP
ncbi:hypothetical protein ACWDRB_49810 [Nonomuraea sp. NPDC003707]